MKKTTRKLAALLIIAFLASFSVRATVLFYDPLNYPNGLIETDGLWQVYYPTPPTAPYGDCYVSNNLIQLVKGNHDSVEAPFTNNTGSTLVYASFTINVTALPASDGSYFAEFQDIADTADVGHLFAATAGTLAPGTYRLGIANYATASSSAEFFPMDLATNTTYYVVMSFDPNQDDPFPGATMVVNPASESDFDSSPAYGRDDSPTAAQLAVVDSAFAVSPYVTAGIGKVYVGTAFSDVFPYTASAPVFGIQPQPTNIYSGNSYTLYAVASGLGALTYQWYSNNVQMSDNGTTIVGSQSNILVLGNLQTSATYTVTVTDTASSASTPSAPALVSVNDTVTKPFFTSLPYGATNGNGSTITLSAAANGTGPITYQWFFEATNANTFTSVGIGSTFSLSPANYSESGLYYVTAMNTAGGSNSPSVTVDVTTPPLVPISYLINQLATNNVDNGQSNLAGGEFFTVQGVVTSFGTVESKTYSEYFIQDATGGALVFVNGTGNTNSPTVGSLVQVVCAAQDYYGQLELTPLPTVAGAITILSANNPLPAPVPLNFTALTTNLSTATMTPYSLYAQGRLLTMTNVYLYSTTNGAAVSGNFPTNSSKTLYLCQSPYSAGAPYLTLYVLTDTNIYNQTNAAYWGQPIPSQCFQLTGTIDFYNPGEPEFIPSRYQDFVVNAPAAFDISVSSANGASTVAWPALVGSTYSLYNAPTVTGPWTQTFGLSYYPSTGTHTVTNAGADQFFKVSTP